MGIIKTIMQAITFVEGLLGRQNGIRALYVALLLIPSFSLLWLYHMSLKDNNELRDELRVQKVLVATCIAEKEDLKEITRDEVMDELKTTLDLINNFKNVISEDNVRLKQQAEEVSTKLNNIQ